MNDQILACCGLECNNCPLLNAHKDPQEAEKIVDWFRSEGWIQKNDGVQQMLREKPYCNGCHGDRSVHWAANCWILSCCADDKKLKNCSQCTDFPCDKLLEWSNENKHYKNAFERLKKLV